MGEIRVRSFQEWVAIAYPEGTENNGEDCLTCHDTGSVECEKCDGEGECSHCGAECEECNGSGLVPCEDCDMDDLKTRYERQLGRDKRLLDEVRMLQEREKVLSA